jgi:cobalt-zinc-cadmium efflux system outer membrane protein
MSNSCWRMGCAIATAFLFSGCSGLPLDQGRSNVQSLVQARAPMMPVAGAVPGEWFAQPLTLERAQQIALLGNPSLKARYAELGLSAADVFEAGRLQNPSLGLSWLLPTGGAEGSKVGASLMTSFADLLLRSSRQRIANLEYVSQQEVIATAVLDVLADTGSAWFECVAANQRVAVRRSIAEAAQLAADLARQYRDAGNISDLELQVQRAEATQARIALHDAQLGLADARATLQKLLGISALRSAWAVPESLPDMPSSAQPMADELAARAIEQRLISPRPAAMCALRVNTSPRRHRLLRIRAWAHAQSEADGARRVGPSVEIALLPSSRPGAVARVEAELAAQWRNWRSWKSPRRQISPAGIAARTGARTGAGLSRRTHP